MRRAHLLLSLVFSVWAAGPTRRANFVRITVDHPAAGRVRTIWRPYAGAIGADAFVAQQAALQRRRAFATNADSVARWRDEEARDTIVRAVPVEFIVDMTAGPVAIESVTPDSVQVTVQLTPERGPRIEAWGRALLIDSDGRAPRVARRR